MQARPEIIFRQLFHRGSCTYTYLLGSRRTQEAILIDPVLEDVSKYLRLLRELDLQLVKAIDTHLHADHATGSGKLRDETKCMTMIGEMSTSKNVARRLSDGDVIEFDGGNIVCHYTPGHTDDSFCFQWENCIFTGDTLFIRGTGCTDFQNGSSYDQYNSIFNKIFKLPDDTWIYPGHDYKGETVSTILEEKLYNPRLQAKNPEEYAKIMSNLNLSRPDLMDTVVPINQNQGLNFEEIIQKNLVYKLKNEDLKDNFSEDILLVDLRDKSEVEKDGTIPNAVNIPYSKLILDIYQAKNEKKNLKSEIKNIIDTADKQDKEIIFFCAYGERSSLAALQLNNMGIKCKSIIDRIQPLKGDE